MAEKLQKFSSNLLVILELLSLYSSLNECPVNTK